MSNLARRPDDITPHSVPKMLPKYAQDKDRPYVGDPWSRQPHEGQKPYVAFCLYRDLPPDSRTLRQAEDIYRERYDLPALPKTKNAALLQKWKASHRWEERVTAWDNFNDAKIQAAHRRQRIRSADKHAKQAADIQSILMRPVDEYRARMAANGGADVVGLLTDEQVLKLAVSFARDLPAMQKAEREALGSSEGERVDPVLISAKRERVLKMLGNKDVGELMERVTIEIAAGTNNDAADDASD